MKRTTKPVHPGAIIKKDILNKANLSITAAAKGLDISRKQLSEIVNETASVSVEMALRLEKAFGVSAEFWLDLQRKYDLWKVQQKGRIHVKTLLTLTDINSQASALN